MKTDGVHRVFHQSMLDFEVELPILLITTPLKDITVYANDDIADILSNPKFREHNLLLVNDEDEVEFFFDAKYIGIIDKNRCARTGKVKDSGMLPIKWAYAEPDSPIMDLVERNIPYVFVADEERSHGFVAESDLQRPPVRILAFTLVTHLEWFLRRAIDVHFSDESHLAALLSHLNMRDWKHIENNRRDDNKRGIEHPLVEYTTLPQKILVLKEVGFLNEQDAQELRTIRDMRNALGHGYAHIHEFIPRLRKTIKWVDHLVTVPNLLD